MKDLNFYSFESLSASELSERLTEQAKQNVKLLQTPTATGYTSQLVTPPIIKNQTDNPSMSTSPSVEVSQESYYIAINNDRKGPFFVSQIKEYLSAGIITSDTLCWRDGFETWIPLSSVETFK